MSFEFRNERARVAGKYPGEFERGPCKAEDFCDSLTIRALRTFCEVNNRELEWVQEYGEPGYVTPENGILIANWNRIPQALQDRLEAQGYELEWSDEWYVDNGKSPTRAWRTQPDGMSWEPRVRARDGYMITPDSDPQEWIDSALNDDDSALPSWFDPSELESRDTSQTTPTERFGMKHEPGTTACCTGIVISNCVISNCGRTLPRRIHRETGVISHDREPDRRVSRVTAHPLCHRRDRGRRAADRN